MMRVLVVLAFAVLLSSWASVRHDTPEANQQIKQDLGISSIVDSSEMNWCIFKYGDDPLCNTQKGAAALTSEELILMRLVDGRYLVSAS
ncbi:MAG: hypothetical protein ACK8QZ_06735 [Anaerolineales bacterium]